MVIAPAFEFGIRRVAVVGIDAELFHVSEVGGERVEIALRERVVFVIVTLAASHAGA